MKHIITILICCSIFVTACNKKKSNASIAALADTAVYFQKQIQTLEAKVDPTNAETFMAINDSISLISAQADSIIVAHYKTTNKDTLFITFEQTRNQEKIKINKVWIEEARYNQINIAAEVVAMDNSSFMGPYTSLSVITKEGKRIEVGGGIGADANVKLKVGNTYIFKGTIDNLSMLTEFKSLLFDEAIKKW